MKKRVLIGLPLGILLIAVVFLDSMALTILVLIFGALAQIEMSKALNAKGYLPTLWTGLVFLALVYPTDYYFGTEGVFLLFSIMIGINMCWAIFHPNRKFADIIMSEFILCYPAIPFYFMFKLKTIEPHVLSIVAMCMALIIASLNDIFALFVGRKFGKRKLSPQLSPNKTVEGAIGGITISTVIGFVTLMILKYYNVIPNIHWIHFLLGCLISAIFAVAGDLIASAVKRFCGLKDFSNIFPGHGGIMDRLDSYLLSTIAIYTYFTLFIL